MSVKGGSVIKKFAVTKPVYSVDFVKGKQDIVFLTDDNVRSRDMILISQL